MCHLQQPSFVEVETTIEESLSELTQYYRSNNLLANPDKTQVTAFHLRNKEAKRTLKVKWNRTYLDNHHILCTVTLDRPRKCKQHIHNTKMKVATRNNLRRKLSSSKWGVNASTIITTALLLSYSVAEYATPVWARSAHVWLQTTQPTSGGAVTVDSSCCANCVEPPRPQQWGPDLPFFGHAGHADPLDGWRCCSQKRVMSRPIQVRQL